jgi:hypothetical protein
MEHNVFYHVANLRLKRKRKARKPLNCYESGFVLRKQGIYDREKQQRDDYNEGNKGFDVKHGSQYHFQPNKNKDKGDSELKF